MSLGEEFMIKQECQEMNRDKQGPVGHSKDSEDFKEDLEALTNFMSNSEEHREVKDKVEAHLVAFLRNLNNFSQEEVEIPEVRDSSRLKARI